MSVLQRNNYNVVVPKKYNYNAVNKKPNINNDTIIDEAVIEKSPHSDQVYLVIKN